MWCLAHTNSYKSKLPAQLLHDIQFGYCSLAQILWHWESSGLYTAKSAYRIMSEGGMIRWRFEFTWKCKILPTAKLFAYLVLKSKILTRGMNYGIHCSLCQNSPIESIAHVLYLCPYAVSVWFNVAKLLKRPIMKPSGMVENIWNSSWDMVRSTGVMPISEWYVRFICTAWFIWKQRSRVVFGDQCLGTIIVASRCVEEMRLWPLFCWWTGTRLVPSSTRNKCKVQYSVCPL